MLNVKAFGGLLLLFLIMAALLFIPAGTLVLAGVDLPDGLFRMVSGDHPLPYAEGP